MTNSSQRPRPLAVPTENRGVNRKGNDTSKRIIDAAREVLMSAGHAQFSMRNVAITAGLHLNNVQYYFRTRDDLVRALMHDTEARYLAAYEACLAAAPPDRIERFKAVLDFNLGDVANPATRQFMIQMWALLNSLDRHTGELLDEFYAMDIGALTERIAEIDPDAAPAEIRRRATMLAAMLEGLIVVRGAHSSNAAEMKRLTRYAHAMGLQIALGKMGTATD